MIATKQPDLKPCPFCGSGSVAHAQFAEGLQGYCLGCDTSGPFIPATVDCSFEELQDRINEAVEAWNTRADVVPSVTDEARKVAYAALKKIEPHLKGMGGSIGTAELGHICKSHLPTILGALSQPDAAAIRDAALEEAANICDTKAKVYKICAGKSYRSEAMGAGSEFCADAIRALKSKGDAS